MADIIGHNRQEDHYIHRPFSEHHFLLIVFLLALTIKAVHLFPRFHLSFSSPLQIYIPALIVISLVKSNLPVFIIMSMLAGTSMAALFLLPW